MTHKPALRGDNRWLPQSEWESLARALHLTRKQLVVRPLAGQDRARVTQPWIEVPLDDHWISAARLTVQGGQVVVAEVRLFPNEPDRQRPGIWSGELLGPAAPVPPGGLSVGTVRKVRISDYRRWTRRILEQLHTQYGATGAALGVAELGLPPEAQSMARPRAARPGTLPDTFYARLAAEYVRLTERGSRRPIAELAARHRVKAAQMRDRIREARERGLLSFGTQGRPGGVLTARAEQMLGKRTKSTRPRRLRR